MAKHRILVVEDEKNILKLLEYNLEKQGYQVFLASTGEEGLKLASEKNPDLVILDLMLPVVDGLEVCKTLQASKSTKNIPIIMLTAKNSEVDQVVGFELGASDYIPKPFSLKVLLARVKNILRYRETNDDARPVIHIGDLSIDKDAYNFKIKNEAVALTKLEFKIIGFLMQNPGKVFSRDQLLNGAWEGEAFVSDRTVDAHVRSIRQKLGKFRDYVETVRGIGYRFVEKD